MNITIDIPESKAPEVSDYVRKIGGRVVSTKITVEAKKNDADNEVTHEVFFGENIKRLIKAFS